MSSAGAEASPAEGYEVGPGGDSEAGQRHQDATDDSHAEDGHEGRTSARDFNEIGHVRRVSPEVPFTELKGDRNPGIFPDYRLVAG